MFGEVIRCGTSKCVLRTSTRGEDSMLAALCTAEGDMAMAARGADAGWWLENLARSRARLPCTTQRILRHIEACVSGAER